MAIYDGNACGYRWEGDSERCPKCSGKSLNVAVTLSGKSISTGFGRVGTVADEPATQGRSHTIRTKTPLGAKSFSEFDSRRGFTTSAAGRSDVGKPGEPQVVRTLIEHLAIRGIAADELKPLDEKQKSRWDADSVVGINKKLRRLSSVGSSFILNTIEAKATVAGGLSFGAQSRRAKNSDEFLRFA